MPGYTGHWRGKKCIEPLAHLKRGADEGGSRTRETLCLHHDLSLHLAAAIHARQVASEDPVQRYATTNRALGVPKAQLEWLARGHGRRPHFNEHKKGDIPGYGSFTRYFDNALQKGVDIHRGTSGK